MLVLVLVSSMLCWLKVLVMVVVRCSCVGCGMKVLSWLVSVLFLLRVLLLVVVRWDIVL